MNFRLRKSPRRPDFAIEPGPGEESVWDYPRPPAVESDNRTIRVLAGTQLLARSEGSYKVMETASPPTYYIPAEAVGFALLIEMTDRTNCEWKGAASYWALVSQPDVPVAWSYEKPRPRFQIIKDYVSFYPGRVACFLDREPVKPQAGQFYGGWMTSGIIGPCKGDPGTGHW
jgi:uncharacterized protein (DUF427 family)